MGRLEKWVIINGILSNGTEKAYPNYDPEDYKELMAEKNKQKNKVVKKKQVKKSKK